MGPAISDNHDSSLQLWDGVVWGTLSRTGQSLYGEAAILQTFPRDYNFEDSKSPVHFSTVGRLIGNAVPPKLAEAIGKEIMGVAEMNNAEDTQLPRPCTS